MKKTLALCTLLALAVPGAFAVPSDVVYTEGDATVRYKSGRVEDAYIGDVLDTGDSVRTGFDGFVEIDQAGLSLKVNPETVFTLQEKEQAGDTAGVLSVVLGSIKFRYDRITGKEPLVQTGSMIAGVRGTEFSVYAGADGSSLIVVDSGLVTVEAEGSAVELAQQEAVEVRPGEPPGEKFAVKRDQIDYSSWNQEKLDAMLADPLTALERIADRMEYYVENVEEYVALYEELKAQVDAEREKKAGIAANEGNDAAKAYENETIKPIAFKAFNSSLNVRYFALAGLSLRRYVGGRLYVLLKPRHMTGGSDSTFSEFADRFRSLLGEFEHTIVPYLGEADI
ncbi:MAG: FecR domain-containing protein [Spirochaetales bacterium]|nr:FecR domain-containing protein [Spirochaetales bacterium]